VWQCSVEMRRAFWERRRGVTMKHYLYFERIVVVGLRQNKYAIPPTEVRYSSGRFSRVGEVGERRGSEIYVRETQFQPIQFTL